MHRYAAIALRESDFLEARATGPPGGSIESDGCERRKACAMKGFHSLKRIARGWPLESRQSDAFAATG